jgi:hypothetical protein
MSQSINIYCDESCHLEKDHFQVMVLGAIWCPSDQVHNIMLDIRKIKIKHGLKSNFEIKWTKVSPAELSFYQEIIKYFFVNKDLHFRALIVPDKAKLRHEEHNQSHDDWYYKMYFDMLKIIFSPQDRYRIYLDIKDTRSAFKIAKLHEVLCNNMYDFSREIIEKVQTVRSHEIEQIQLADLLIGAVSYANRNLESSEAKLSLIEILRQLSGYRLTNTTLYRENKVNLFRWHAQEELE